MAFVAVAYIVVCSAAFTFATDRCDEQLDQRLHLIMAGREWTLMSLTFRDIGI